MPKIKYPENIQKLKEQLETNNNLVDYFFICGLSPSECTNELLYKVSSEENLENIKNILKPTILSRFPEFNKQNYEVGEEILEYCFPNGFELIYNNSSIPYRKIFTIILDNNNNSQDYPQKYLTCILFYEQLYQYKKLQQQIENIEKNKENNINPENNENINNMRSKLEEEKSMNIYRHKKIASSSALSFNFRRSKKITEKDLKDINININNINIKEKNDEINTQQPLNKLKYYYIPKCICLLSIHPRIKLFQKILLHLYEYGLLQNVEIPLEKIITNLIIEVPLPPRGLYSINYNYFYENYENKENKININNNNNQESAPNLKSTENNKLLISEVDLRKFNKSLSFNCKMEVIKHILLNSKILFFSQNLTTLTDIIYSFLILIFPFKYSFNVTSFLKKNFYYMLGTPTPFIFGINQEYDKNFFEENEISLEQMTFLVIDLDSKNDNNYYLFSDEEFPQLPLKLVSNLEKELKNLENYDKNNINNNINNNKESNERNSILINKENTIKEFNEKYQEKFFHFFCEILKGYEEFLNRDFFNDDFVSITTLFNCEKFIKSSYHSQSDYDFYSKFVDISQLFMDFIFKNMIPKNNNELMDILIVNNYFQKKKKKSSNELDPYLINNKYVVPFPKELTKEELEEIINKKISLSKKGQIINNLNKNINQIKFEYPLFPSLDFDIYCNNDNVNQYITPPDYREEIEALNMESISKSSLGKNINRAMEMKNYIYLTWLEIWAYTFGNNDFGEKHYRFDQMLDVLDKVIHHEMNILNLMFDILNKYSEHQMMLKLYQKLLSLRLNPSITIYDTMTKILDKDKMKDLLDESKKNKENKENILQLKFNDYNKNNFRERTFLSINDNLPLETKPKFYFDYFCIICGEKINLYLISKNFEGIKNDTLWVKCAQCGEYILPKIKVKFGLDFINDKSKSTSIKEYVLHSPYNLKINIKQAVNTQFRSLNKDEKIKLKISNFKAEFQPLFWDFIWYCIIHNLDYNILLPYSKTLEEEKKAHYFNPNINLFEVIYDDSTFKDNQNKIEKISNSIIQLNSGEKDKKKIFKNLKNIGIIKLEIINKKINLIIQNYEENKINKIEENDKNKIIENNDKKNDVINKEGKNPSIKKKFSMFDFFYNTNKKSDEIKSDTKKENDK